MTQELVQELFDYKNGELYWKKKLSFRKNVGTKVGHVSKKGYCTTCVNYQHYYIHRLVFLMFKGYLPKQVDHINGNPSDNRIENLREATPQQNAWNKKKKSNTKSGIKGIYWHLSKQKWHARIGVNYKHIHVGYYDDLVEAEKAVIEKRTQICKEFTKHE